MFLLPCFVHIIMKMKVVMNDKIRIRAPIMFVNVF
jgi:hypothetical protein